MAELHKSDFQNPLLAWIDSRLPLVRSARFRPIFGQVIWLWVTATIMLGVVGAHQPLGIWVPIGRLCTLYYY